MAKLYFYYSSMNAGKSTLLLQSAFNYEERGMSPLLFTAEIDTRYGVGQIKSRIGLQTDAQIFNATTNMFDEVKQVMDKRDVHCILIDEAQFLSKDQVFQCAEVCDQLNLPVLTYGIRTDFQANLFEGSMHLLAIADELKELKTICICGRKATMNLRLDGDGKAIQEGAQTDIGGNERYEALCRRCFSEKLAE